MAGGRGPSTALRLRWRAARHTPNRLKQAIARASARPGVTRRLVAQEALARELAPGMVVYDLESGTERPPKV